MPDGIAITWYGHATWGLESLEEGTHVLLDPWLSNPRFPEGKADSIRADVIALTHGHGDHTGDVVDVAARLKAPVLAPVELADALEAHGVENVTGFGKGGTVFSSDVSFLQTNAVHTGSIQINGEQAGYCEPSGYVIGFLNGTRVYAAGDTAIHSDMALIKELYAPTIAILPIGGHYTMDPFQAAHATRMLGVTHVFPGHWGTFPLLAGTPEQLRGELAKLGLEHVHVHDVEPGKTVS